MHLALSLLVIQVWHRFLSDGEPRTHGLLEALRQCGVACRRFDGDSSTGPGVLFFGEINPPLCEFLRDVSRNGLERVLAVALSSEALAGGRAWLLLHSGASDVFAWDHSPNPAAEVAARFERWNTVDRLMASSLVQKNLVGSSPAWTSVLRQIVEVAHFTDAPILISGESGTGKEGVARLIHDLDPRPRKKDLQLLDCTTVVPELAGSEFFGHERGAFTGAITPRHGAFALADQGTLFLDEVGELPLSLQAELLRVVQEKTYKRVGSNTWQRTDFRLVCATNRDLLELQTRGEFRRDLYYRIAGWTCRLPPLRERSEDILPLARHFMQQLRPDEDPPELDPAVSGYLLARDYPGNVRDLKQLVFRMMSRHVARGPITIGDIPREEAPPPEGPVAGWRDQGFENAIRRALTLGVGLKGIARAAGDTAIRIALANQKGNLQRAALSLGVTDRALQMRRAAQRAHEGLAPAGSAL